MGKVLIVYIKVSGMLFQPNFHLKNNYKLLKLSIDYKDEIVINIYSKNVYIYFDTPTYLFIVRAILRRI